MAEIIREFITVDPNEETSKSLFESLSKQYSPLLRSTFLKARRLLRLPAEETRLVPELGELFVAPDSMLYYVLKFSSGFEVGSIVKDSAKANHEQFMKSVLSTVRGERQPIQPVNRTFSALVQDFGHSSFNQEDRQAAQLLAQASTRKYLREIVAAGRKERSEKDAVPSNAVLEELRKLDLLKHEFLVFCRHSGKQIMTVESMGAIEEASRHGFKCFTCGRSFSEEKLTQFVSRTPQGRKVSAENRWLLVNTLAALEEWLMSRQFSVVADGSVTDVFINLQSSLILVEIKESPYQLKDAYSLSQKVRIYKPAAVFLLHASPVSSQAESWLESAPFFPSFARGESLETLKEALTGWVRLATRNHVRETLERFTELSTLDVDELTLSSLFSGVPPESSLELPSEAPPAPAEPQTGRSGAPLRDLPVVAAEEPVPDPWSARNAILEKLALELSGDITGRESSLHVLLQDLGELAIRWKACLLSEDGLVVATTADEETSELLASFGGECFAISKKIHTAKNSGTLASVTLASKNFSVELSRLPGFYNEASEMPASSLARHERASNTTPKAFYLALVANLETLVPPPLAGLDRAKAFEIIRDQLFARNAIQWIKLLNEKGKVTFEAAKENEAASSFCIPVEAFASLSSPFASFGKGSLEAIAVRSSCASQALVRAGRGFFGVSCQEGQVWENLLPTFLAFADQIASLS